MANEDPATAFQFRLKTLLIAMTATCIVIAAAKLLPNDAVRGERPIFGTYTFIVFVLSGLVVWRYLAQPLAADGLAPPSLALSPGLSKRT